VPPDARRFQIHGTTTYSFSPDQRYVDETIAKLNPSLSTEVQKKKKLYVIVGLKVVHCVPQVGWAERCWDFMRRFL